MIYENDLNDYDAEDLEFELARRKALREAGKCDYCGQEREKPACKFPKRHHAW